jgi:hypothetical protein
MSEEKLDKILESLDKGKKRKWVETLSTILLSAATLLSAWCVYEASQWNGEQYFRIEDVNLADRDRLQNELTATQRQTAQMQLFLAFISARNQGNEELAEFLLDRFPSYLREATEAWYVLDPLNNPDAPRSPFDMEEYVLPERAAIEKFDKQAKEFKTAANEADNHSDNYMLLSAILSMVLFFSGLCGAMNSYLNQRILLGLASIIFLVALFFVFRMPVIM